MYKASKHYAVVIQDQIRDLSQTEQINWISAWISSMTDQCCLYPVRDSQALELRFTDSIHSIDRLMCEYKILQENKIEILVNIRSRLHEVLPDEVSRATELDLISTYWKAMQKYRQKTEADTETDIETDIGTDTGTDTGTDVEEDEEWK